MHLVRQLNPAIQVSTVIQHDLNIGLMSDSGGTPYGPPIELDQPGGITLATGDSFIDDAARREVIGQRAALVDMEGYAVAAVGARAGVPVRIVKEVSDNADASADRTWPDQVAVSARILAEWVSGNLV